MSLPAAAAQLGLIGRLQFLPLFVTTPITGWVADRFDRRWITRVTLCLQVFCALVLAIATHEGVMGLPILFSIAVLLGDGRAFAGPAFSVPAPTLVPPEVLQNAIPLSSHQWPVGSLAGSHTGIHADASWHAWIG